MGCFQVRYDSGVVIYERKLFIRLATGDTKVNKSFYRGGADNKSNPFLKIKSNNGFVRRSIGRLKYLLYSKSSSLGSAHWVDLISNTNVPCQLHDYSM